MATATESALAGTRGDDGVTHTRSWRRWLGVSAVVAWAGGLSVVLAALMVPHWVPLPTPALDAPSLAPLRGDADGRRWTAYHALDMACGCSRRVAATLLERGPEAPGASASPGARHVVLLVGDAPEEAAKLAAAGFEVRPLSRDALGDDYDAEAVPLLLVADPTGQLRYSGGHTARKGGLALEDRAILARLSRGEAVEPLPLYGCGVSSRLQAALDPLRLKY